MRKKPSFPASAFRTISPGPCVVVITGSKITAVGPASTAIPAGATRVDVKGKTLLPGLINAHGHAAQDTAATLKKFARYGVTTVVSLGGEDARHVALPDAPDPAALDHPRLYVAGPVQEHQSIEAAERGIAQLQDMDVDFVKARVDRGSMPPQAYGPLIRAAHARDLKVAVHMYTLDDTKGLVRAGVDLLAHSVRDQPVDAGVGGEVERHLHFVEGGGDAGLLDPLMDEHEKFVLLAGKHGAKPLGTKRKRFECSLGVPG